MRHLLWLIAGPLLAGSLVSHPAAGQDPGSDIQEVPPSPAVESPDFPDRFSLAAGGFLMKYVKSTISFNVKGVPLGTTVDLADDLNHDKSGRVLRVDGYYRFSPRHRIDVNWYRFAREGSSRLGRDIQVGDETFQTGTDVESKTILNIVKLGYGYSFYHEERVELGIGIGLHFMDINFDIKGTETDTDESGGGVLPLPNFRFMLDYAISPRAHILGQSQVFFIEIGDYGGSMTDFWTALQYQAFRNFGAGVAFNRFVLDVDAQDTDFSGAASIVFNGFQLYLFGKL